MPTVNIGIYLKKYITFIIIVIIYYMRNLLNINYARTKKASDTLDGEALSARWRTYVGKSRKQE